jgi:hypothetical protein
MDDLRNILAKTDLFSGLSQEDLDTVAKAFSEKKVEKDQEILVSRDRPYLSSKAAAQRFMMARPKSPN